MPRNYFTDPMLVLHRLPQRISNRRLLSTVSARGQRFPFASADIHFSGRCLASIDKERSEQDGSAAAVAQQHGWEVIEHEQLIETQFEPYAFRRGSSVLLAFHGTNAFEWRQVSSAGCLALGQMPHTAFSEALYWTKWIVRTHGPVRLGFCGHSMGGALSEMLGVYFTSGQEVLPGVQDLGVISFDSPSFPLQSFRETVRCGEHDHYAILQYKSAPTVVNTRYPPVGGEVRRVMVPHVDNVRYGSKDLVADVCELGVDFEPWLRLARGGTTPWNAAGEVMQKTALKKAYELFSRDWVRRQHSIQRLSMHLHQQYRVSSWPTQGQVMMPQLRDLIDPWEVRDLPVVGPMLALKQKLLDKEWDRDMSHARRQIEERVLQTAGFSQHAEALPPEQWDTMALLDV